mmetsp:Transcript_40362/g.72474  ORF Transcript_40362/g.72474 Transcript_40362/m.72474 type:complete len:376 (+) Transcript_40362:83-1210(+)
MGSELSAERHVEIWEKRPLARFFAVARHAERADDMDALLQGGNWSLTQDSWTWPLDPPLSDAGREGAKQLGMRIASSARESRIAIHVVLSSPFLRCIQTAVAICQEAGPKCRLLVDNSLGEVFGPSVMGDTEPSVTTRDVAEILQQQKDLGIRATVEVTGIAPEWPESLRRARERFAERFLQYVISGQSLRRNFVIVSHADCVGAALSCMRSSTGWLAARSVQYAGHFTAIHRDVLTTIPSDIEELPVPDSPTAQGNETDNLRMLTEGPELPDSIGWEAFVKKWHIETVGVKTSARRSTFRHGATQAFAAVAEGTRRLTQHLNLAAKEEKPHLVKLLESLPKDPLGKEVEDVRRSISLKTLRRFGSMTSQESPWT